MSLNLSNSSMYIAFENGEVIQKSTALRLFAEIVDKYQNEKYWFYTGIVVTLCIFYIIIMLGGFIGNTLVLLVILFRKKLHTWRNIYIINLSISGAIMCSVCMPFALVKYTLKQWSIGGFLCRLLPSLSTIDVFVSTFTLMAIAVDRHKSVTYATRSYSHVPGQRSPQRQVVIFLPFVQHNVPLAMCARNNRIHPCLIYEVI